jgi:hypothetical protein
MSSTASLAIDSANRKAPIRSVVSANAQSDLATLIASLAIIVIGPLLSAVDGLLNPN